MTIEYVHKSKGLKIKLNTNADYTGIKKMMNEKNLHTVYEEAKCLNIHECWAERKTQLL